MRIKKITIYDSWSNLFQNIRLNLLNQNQSQMILMNLDKAVFYNGKDLYDHLNKRINEKPEDEPSILGEVVKLMEAPQNLKF